MSYYRLLVLKAGTKDKKKKLVVNEKKFLKTVDSF